MPPSVVTVSSRAPPPKRLPIPEPNAALPPLAIEPPSLYAIAPTLRKLVVANARLDDDALEPLVVLQGLTTLDVRANRLASIARLQQLLLRLPSLESLHLAANPLCDAPKTRERLIVAAPRLAEVDGKAVKPNERAFLHSLAARQSLSASGKATPEPPSGDDAFAIGANFGGKRASRQSSAGNRGRPQQLGVSIPSAQSYNLGPRAGLVRRRTAEAERGARTDAVQDVLVVLDDAEPHGR